MNKILDQLEVIDFGLSLATDVAQNIYEILESLTTEDEEGHFDEEERVLAESFERGEWSSVKNVKREIQNLHDAARNTLRKSYEDGKHHNPTGPESG